MHGRTGLLALAIICACWLPASAAAAPMPAGTYDIQLNNGTLNLGDGVLPPMTLDTATTFSAPIGVQPISEPIGLTVSSAPVSISGINATIDMTVAGAGITVDPTTGGATVDASFYGTVSLSGTVGGFPVSGSCTIGSQATPVTIHLDTAKGSAWDPATGQFSMADNTFAVPHSCTPSLEILLAALVGNLDVGDNSAILTGIATRRPDPPPPTTTSTPTTTAVPTTTSAPGTTTTTTGNPAETTPLTAPTAVKSCVVPKLVGKTLKQAKRALKKAGCKVGKAKKQNSKKRKKGRILKQRYKAGTKLPAGTKIPLTVSKGKKKASKVRSR